MEAVTKCAGSATISVRVEQSKGFPHFPPPPRQRVCLYLQAPSAMRRLFFKEEVYMKFMQLLKGKLFVTLFAGVVLIGGATVAFASTPAGQGIIHAGVHAQSTATTAGKASHKNKDHTATTTGQGNSCPGLSKAQQLASE